MSFFSDLFAGGAKGIVDGVASAVDRFVQTDQEKAALALEVEKVVTERMAMMEESAKSTVQARMSVIVAELQHGDDYVKHTRPMIARWGLYVIIANYAAFPLLRALLTSFGIEASVTLPAYFELPTEFWIAWGGIVGTYSVGRSFEKVGVRNKATALATGSPNPDDIAARVLG